ncbi:unnamed protein product [Camellia sinensis]
MTMGDQHCKCFRKNEKEKEKEKEKNQNVVVLDSDHSSHISFELQNGVAQKIMSSLVNESYVDVGPNTPTINAQMVRHFTGSLAQTIFRQWHPQASPPRSTHIRRTLRCRSTSPTPSPEATTNSGNNKWRLSLRKKIWSVSSTAPLRLRLERSSMMVGRLRIRSTSPWKKSNDLVRKWIRDTITEDIKKEVKHVWTAKGLWTRFEKWYGTPSPAPAASAPAPTVASVVPVKLEKNADHQSTGDIENPAGCFTSSGTYADDYSISLGAAATVCGVVIGAMAVAQVLDSARAVNKRYISDCEPLKMRMQAFAGFVSASALGMACGPALACLLQTQFKLFNITFNENTLPGWVMALAWLIYLLWLWISFREPSFYEAEDSVASLDAKTGMVIGLVILDPTHCIAG